MSKFNAAFWKWFGNSKVVDAKGRPLVVYHGTDSELFDVFDLNKIGARTGAREDSDFGMWGTGFYFTPTKKHSYGDKSIAAYLSIQNPLIMVGDDEWPEDLRPVRGRRASEELRSHILDLGYDGVIHYDHHPDRPHPIFPSERVKKRATQIVAFFSEQIKAVDNDGTWDTDDPNIRSNPMTPAETDILTAEGMAEKIASETESFLAWLEGRGMDVSPLDAIYFYGSRAAGKGRGDSDWDFVAVGQDFSDVERERIDLAESGELPNRFKKLFGIDTATNERGQHIDVVFDEIKSDSPIRFKSQKTSVAVKVWPKYERNPPISDLQRGLKRAMAAGDREAVAALSAEIKRLENNPPLSKGEERLLSDMFSKKRVIDGLYTKQIAESYGITPAKVLKHLLPLANVGSTEAEAYEFWDRPEHGGPGKGRFVASATDQRTCDSVKAGKNVSHYYFVWM